MRRANAKDECKELNAKDECKEYLTPTHKTSSKPWIWRVWSIIIIGHHRLSFVISIHIPFVQKILCTMSDAGILASKTSSDRQEHKTSWVTLWPNDLDLEPFTFLLFRKSCAQCQMLVYWHLKRPVTDRSIKHHEWHYDQMTSTLNHLWPMTLDPALSDLWPQLIWPPTMNAEHVLDHTQNYVFWPGDLDLWPWLLSSEFWSRDTRQTITSLICDHKIFIPKRSFSNFSYLCSQYNFKECLIVYDF